MKNLLLIIIVSFSALAYSQKINVIFGNGTPACPEPINWKLPDNNFCTVYLKGDMIVNWFESTDGYMLLKNESGYFEYAVYDSNQNAVPSGIIFHDADKRNSYEQNFVQSLEKGIFYSQTQMQEFRNNSHLSDNSKAVMVGGFPSTGTRKMLMILAKFSDTSPTYTQTQFTNLMNQAAYNGTGSFKDFYSENSYGQLTINTTVTAWVTVPNTRSYYSTRKAEFVRDAVNAADNAGIDFSQFDNDGNGYVDGVAVIHTGQGQEVSGNTLDIWSHNWSLSAAGFTVQKDGKYVNSYTCQPEKYTSSTMVNIGVICHEVGHNLGLPDFYDTDYSTGGSYSGTGNWDCMAGGSYNYSGKKPAHHNAWSKIYLGWTTAVVLTDPANVIMQNVEQNQQIYRINTVTTNEYYLLENRQKIGFDANIPSSGLIIYHRHKDFSSYTSSNTLNATHPQKFYPVVASNTSDAKQTGTYGTINGTGCPFPGSAGKTSFTDATTPNMKTWSNANNSSPITEIVHNTTSKEISFKFKGGSTSTLLAQFTASPTSGSAPLAVTFTNSSTGSPTSYSWNFGDGSTSTAQNPSHTYSSNGTYTVTLTISGSGGSNTMTKTNYIVVSNSALPNNECTGAITLMHESACNPTSATTSGATESMGAITCNGYTGVADDDVWFKFVATATSATINVEGGASFDAVIELLSGACNGTNINCTDADGDGGPETLSVTGLTIGSTYYIRIYHYDAGSSATPTFTICVSGGNSTSVTPPTVTTSNVSSVTSSGASCGGNVTSDGGASVSQRGICYSTNQNPTTANAVINSGTGTGSFSCNITNLASNTTYYVRAFAINSAGTNYGSQNSFTTSSAVVSVTGVALSPSSLILTIGGSTAQLTATLQPSNATNQNVTWNSSNTSVANVSNSGLVTPMAAGNCVIAVTTQDGNFSSYCTVTVNANIVAVTGISLTPNTLNLTTGTSGTQLTAGIQPSNASNQNIIWASGNSSIATVSNTGFVTPVGVGNCVIAVTSQDGNFTATCNVTVTSSIVSVTGINVYPDNISIQAGGNTAQLTAFIQPSNATNQNVSWSSDNPLIASVSSSGLITSINPGNCIITVTSQDGNYSAICYVSSLTNTNELFHNNSYFEIYPNPCANEFNLKTETSDEFNLKFFNSIGSEIKLPVKKISKELTSINTSELCNGIYFLEIKSKNHVIVKKILINK